MLNKQILKISLVSSQGGALAPTPSHAFLDLPCRAMGPCASIATPLYSCNLSGALLSLSIVASCSLVLCLQ